MIEYCKVWYYMLWYDLAGCDMPGYDTVWQGVICHSMLLCAISWYSVECYVIMWYGIVYTLVSIVCPMRYQNEKSKCVPCWEGVTLSLQSRQTKRYYLWVICFYLVWYYLLVCVNSYTVSDYRFWTLDTGIGVVPA